MARKTDNIKMSNKKYTPTSKVGVVSEANQKNEKKSSGTSIFIFFFILIIISLGIGVIFSPSFDVVGVVIKDGENVSSGEISVAADVKIGENILKQNYKTIVNNVSSIPYIKDVSIKLLFPNKIEIDYEEREPYSLIKYLESYIVIDKFGYILEIKKGNDLYDLPVIYGIEMDNCELGTMLKDTARIKYQNIVLLLETARQREFPYNIYEIDYEKIGEMKFWVKDIEIDIIYGEINKNTISDKLSYLAGILKKIEKKEGKLNISSDNYLEKTIFTERH